MNFAIYLSVLTSAVIDMLSFNQQGVTDASFDISSETVFAQQWPNTQPAWNNSIEHSQLQNWTQQVNCPPANSFTQPHLVTQYQQPHQFNNNYDPSHIIATGQLNQFPVCYPQHHHQLQQQHALAKPRHHQARISLVPNTSGGFKAIVKRKRKRTMFTTEQVEAMESVFQRKPYVTRDDRQVLVEQLQLDDTAVKVWFQNRRLRGKRAAEEAAAEAAEQAADQAVIEALYGEQMPSELSFQNNNVSCHQESTDAPMSNMSRLDIIESELLQNVNDSGFITLDEKSIQDIISAIDNVLAPSVNLELDMAIEPEGEKAASGPPSESAAEESEDSAYAGSVYEPVSPAASPASVSTDEETAGWRPIITPEESLQKLFDMHFC